MKLTRGHLFGLVAALAVSIAALGACAPAASPSKSTMASGNQAAGQPSKSGGSRGSGFAETPIGDEVQIEGLNVAAVYFQPVEMEPPEKAGLKPADADIHLEADIHALKDNQTGFGAGEWIGYLTVKYNLKNLDSGKEQDGSLMPMNAKDGPHYGANAKMTGAGKYKLSLNIQSPENQGYLLHVDQETGVPGRFWRKPLETSWEFNYLPRKF